jgi:hypothetical protein
VYPFLACENLKKMIDDQDGPQHGQFKVETLD